VHKLEMSEVRIEPVLERHLGPVTAPDELWKRIQYPKAPRQQAFHLRLVWALPAGLLVLAMMWAIYPGPEVHSTQALGMRALSRGPADLEFRSAEAGEIQAWVKTRTGLDVPILAEPAPTIRLLGAQVVTGRTMMAEVGYRIGDRDAVLLISKADSTRTGNGRHSGPFGDTRYFSWAMGGQVYTLACATPEDLRVACQLCHADARSQTSFN
jgi:hypothetical protein